jgi:hypothetical protein
MAEQVSADAFRSIPPSRPAAGARIAVRRAVHKLVVDAQRTRIILLLGSGHAGFARLRQVVLATLAGGEQKVLK